MRSKRCLFDNNPRKAQQHYNHYGASCANSHDRIDVFGKLNINKLGENREQNSLPKLRETGDIKCSRCHHSINEYNLHLWLAQTEILVSTPYIHLHLLQLALASITAYNVTVYVT